MAAEAGLVSRTVVGLVTWEFLEGVVRLLTVDEEDEGRVKVGKKRYLEGADAVVVVVVVAVVGTIKLGLFLKLDAAGLNVSLLDIFSHAFGGTNK